MEKPKETIPKNLFYLFYTGLQRTQNEADRFRLIDQIGKDIGRKLVRNKKFSDIKFFAEDLVNILKNELELTDNISYTVEKDKLTIHIEECKICPANEILRKEGLKPRCPIIHLVIAAAMEGLKEKIQSASLIEVQKPGPVGVCNLIYNIQL
jgi:predicted hydrocarbon binding protein